MIGNWATSASFCAARAEVSAKETYYTGKRDLLLLAYLHLRHCVHVPHKQTYYIGKRDLTQTYREN